MKPKTIYLASPYGFAAQWKNQLLPVFVETLESLGLEVWEPFARNNQVDFSSVFIQNLLLVFSNILPKKKMRC